MTLPFDIVIGRAISYGLLACGIGGLYLMLGVMRANEHTPFGEVPSKRQVFESTIMAIAYTVFVVFSVTVVGYVLAVVEQVVLA